jgi:hypothetical protein
MFACLAGKERLKGKTVLLVDISGSMTAQLSRRSEMLRTDAAYGLAILLREICEEVSIYSFSDQAKRVPSRRGVMRLTAASVTMAPTSASDGDVRPPDRHY